jgi:hypothetical protein
MASSSFTVSMDEKIQIQRGLSITMREWDVLREMDYAGLVPNTMGMKNLLHEKQKAKEAQFLQPYADVLFDHIYKQLDVATVKAEMMASDQMETTIFCYKNVIWNHLHAHGWQGEWRCNGLIRQNKWRTSVMTMTKIPEWEAYPYEEEEGYNYTLIPTSVDRILRRTDLLLRLNTLFGSEFGVRLVSGAAFHTATEAEPFSVSGMEIRVRYYGKACPMRLPKLLATYQKYKTHTPYVPQEGEVVVVE